MRNRLARILTKLEMRADALVKPPDPLALFWGSLWASLATKPDDPEFGRIRVAILKAFVEERERTEGRSSEPPTGMSMEDVCRNAALAMDATIQADRLAIGECSRSREMP